MKIHSKTLKKACRLLSAGKAQDVIRLLEPKLPLFLEDPSYYAILGRAYLELGVLREALTYLERGLQADPDHREIQQVLAVTYLKKKDPPSAVKMWLEVLENQPRDKYATKGLKTLKRISDAETQAIFLEKLQPQRYLPNFSPRRLQWKTSLLIALPIILAILFLQKDLLTRTLKNITIPTPPSIQRKGGENLLNPGSNLIEEKSTVLYPMTERELSQTLKKALKYYRAYEDNKARLELNKILNSNAREEVQSQANMLRSSLSESTLENLETNYTYKDISNSPWLYKDCWIRWQGLTANIVFDEDKILFDFLVGYNEGKVLEGRVPVTVPFLAVIEPLPLELLAKVKPVGDNFELEAKTLHFLR